MDIPTVLPSFGEILPTTWNTKSLRYQRAEEIFRSSSNSDRAEVSHRSASNHTDAVAIRMIADHSSRSLQIEESLEQSRLQANAHS